MIPNNTTTAPVLVDPITVNLKQIIEHGESPTAIILAISVLVAVLLGSLAKLFYVIGLVPKHKSPSQKSEK